MRRVLVALPFVLGPFALRCSVAPLGDALARAVIAAAPAPASAAASGVVVIVPKPVLEGVDPSPADFVDDENGTGTRAPDAIPLDGKKPSDTARDAGAHEAGVREAGAPEAAPSKVFVVPATAVARALERRDVGAVNAIAEDGTPVGARLVGVSKYGTGLRDGDIVVSVAGTRTPNVSAMVSAGLGAIQSGATRLGGRVVRGNVTYGVVLEVPPR